jgi:2-amino-4-hydroxy-6-hydroxymethyldihydropteridine diphosphokinase
MTEATDAYIGIGANIGDACANVARAIVLIRESAPIDVIAVSPLYRSKPWGVIDQPDFVNAVVKIRTRLSAEALLNQLLQLEKQAGRVRALERYGPRTLDLDILIFGDQVIASPSLTIPHPRMLHRAFVLKPLHDIEPNLVLTGGEKLADLVKQIDAAELIKISPP